MVIRKDNTLIGRYWGAAEDVPNLHFELCYYAPLEYAIGEKITLFDPGMGSPHKARRGFESREFSTWHSFDDPDIAALFSSVLPEANVSERNNIGELNKSVPWKER